MGNIGSKEKQKAGNYFKGLMKKAQEAINLVIGNSEVYSEEDTAGDLRFDPAVMMKINVTFDKEFLPKEKVVKLNVRGNRFFYDIKRNIREINGLWWSKQVWFPRLPIVFGTEILMKSRTFEMNPTARACGL